MVTGGLKAFVAASHFRYVLKKSTFFSCEKSAVDKSIGTLVQRVSSIGPSVRDQTKWSLLSLRVSSWMVLVQKPDQAGKVTFIYLFNYLFILAFILVH